MGRNISNYLNEYEFNNFKKGEVINLNEYIVINCAGKAHDLKNVTSTDEYYKVNTEFTKEVFKAFLASNAKVFITLSSVKAVADVVSGELFEEVTPSPITHYGKSKLLAEEYILLLTAYSLRKE